MIPGEFKNDIYVPLHNLTLHRRKHRRLSALFLSKQAVSSYIPGLQLEVREMLKNLYVHGQAGVVPVNPQPHAGRTSLNNILTIAFGTRTDTIEHPLVAHWLKHSREFMYVTHSILHMCIHLISHIGIVPAPSRTLSTLFHSSGTSPTGPWLTVASVSTRASSTLAVVLSTTSTAA